MNVVPVMPKKSPRPQTVHRDAGRIASRTGPRLRRAVSLTSTERTTYRPSWITRSTTTALRNEQPERVHQLSIGHAAIICDTWIVEGRNPVSIIIQRQV